MAAMVVAIAEVTTLAIDYCIEKSIAGGGI